MAGQSESETQVGPVLAPPLPLGQDGSDATQAPSMQRSLGQAVLPSGHRRHAMPSGGQSESLVHILPVDPPAPVAPPDPDGHGGNDVTHRPLTQSAVAQLALPSGHSLQTCGTAH